MDFSLDKDFKLELHSFLSKSTFSDEYLDPQKKVFYSQLIRNMIEI
jgi:hypothetical protein